MDFESFFRALHGEDREGKPITPFPWQARLANEVLNQGWRSILDLPTASGKTSAIDVALFHLIQETVAIKSGQLERRRAPLRIFFIVDRRIVVDGAYQHARRIAGRLRDATEGPLAEAASILRDHFKVENPLHVSLMRGGMYRDSGWSASPVQPTICVSTVDQVGSRLLFRGYGVSASMRPIHAGLVANDSLLLIDEAHLSEPFLQTLAAVQMFSSNRFAQRHVSRPMQVVRMSATTKTDKNATEEPFRIDQLDRTHPVLGRRFSSSKIARLEKVAVDKDNSQDADDEFATEVVTRALELSGLAVEKSAVAKKKSKKKSSTVVDAPPARVIGIVVNRVRTARLIFDKLRKRKGQFRDPLDSKSGAAFETEDLAEAILLTGRMRPFDRDELLFRKPIGDQKGWLAWIKSGRTTEPPAPVFVVATQTVEVGADLDFDALISEAAPLDCLRQRFGRLDRRGRRGCSDAIIMGRSTDVAKTAKDRVYGDRLSATWQWLEKNASGKGKDKAIDFGITAMEQRLAETDLATLCASTENAPTLLPPYIDLWSRTNPVPAADPDVAPFLHGPNSNSADVQIVWRADLLHGDESELSFGRVQDYINAVALLPPTSMEACSVPIYEAKRWLGALQSNVGNDLSIGDVADVEGSALVESKPSKSGKLVLRWKGAEKSKLGSVDDLRPGDTIVVPASYGGHDDFGWQPGSTEAKDVADSCSRWGRARSAVRLHPGLLTAQQWGVASSELLPSEEDEIEYCLRSLCEREEIPNAVRRSCSELLDRKSRWSLPYEITNGSEGNWVIVGRNRLGIEQLLAETQGEVDEQMEDAVPDDDDGSSFTGSGEPTTLDDHTDGVVCHVKQFAELAGLNAEVSADLELTARWHDVGKIDERFQTLLHNGNYVDAVLALSSGRPLAKSGQTFRDLAARSRAARSAGVPKGFRHEALTVILLRHSALRQLLDNANDSELIEYLSGSHHGNGRASHGVVMDDPPAIEATWNSQTIVVDKNAQVENALYRLDNDWEGLFVRMNRRYGTWGLAWLEAIFRLADHQQSALDAIQSLAKEKSSV